MVAIASYPILLLLVDLFCWFHMVANQFAKNHETFHLRQFAICSIFKDIAIYENTAV